MKLTSRHSQKSSSSRNPKRPNNILLGIILVIANVIANSTVILESAYAHESFFREGDHGPRTYSGITRSRFSCMKKYRNSEGYIVTKGGDVGTAEARQNGTGIWGATVNYYYTPDNEKLKIEIKGHEWGASVTSQDVWDYVNEMLSNC